MDDQQRARELWSDALRKVGQHKFAYHVGCGGDLDLSEQATLDAITAALRAAPEAVALRTAMTTLEQIANAPDDQGAKFNAMGALRFLQTQPVELRAATEEFGSLPPVEHVRYWAEAYGPQATEPHFQGHAMVAHLLAEYADLLERLAARPQGVKDV